MVKVKIKLMDNGKLPSYQRDGDACLDCYSAEDLYIPTNGRTLVKLGFALELPKGYEAIIRPRSGLTKNEIDCAIGTIDSNYRGEVSANIINNSNSCLKINFGDRICQLAIREAPQVELMEVEELTETERGGNGFGSSGI